jgi:FtsP/CotA-like multicopper oxidase with cupredoxin domain
MKNRNVMNVWRLGLLFTLMCLLSIPGIAGAGYAPPIPTGPLMPDGVTPATPDYYTTANWAYSPPLAKFVDTLPGLTAGNQNTAGQYLSVGNPDITTYPGSDYYEIDLIEYRQKMHPDLPDTQGPTTGSTVGTLLRGYVQVNKGTSKAACADPSLPVCVAPQVPSTLPLFSTCRAAQTPLCTTLDNTVAPSPVHFLGPILVTQRDRPVRIKFTNKLPIGLAGDLFVPVDTSVMGAGVGPAYPDGTPCNSTLDNAGCASYTQNRSAIHLHGGKTPWISDGTPHQWIVPAGETTPFIKGVSLQNVPDMPDPGDGSTTYYYTNQQSARLMFYHEHAWGITRLNPYVGVAAGYLITDQWEQDLIARGVLPPYLDQIPLVIQDRTFVDARPATKYLYNPATGLFDTPITLPTVRVTDPLWNWGSSPLVNGVREPVTGDLWTPHVYMPAQTQLAGAGGANAFGRWMYGPWFYPATVISKGPVTNPYYDQDCSSPFPNVYANCTTPGQPTQIPGTPHPSMGMEAFQDSAVVNGAAFPSLTVEPRAYRFRILNAANDRFWNLSIYKADTAQVSPDPRLNSLDPAYIVGRSNRTEVKMATASASLATQFNWPSLWPVDGRAGDVPDPGVCSGTGAAYTCSNFGPKFLQIGTESGFLPTPVLIDHQPITYNTDPTAFWVGNVNKMGLALGPAERADVIVDFSNFAGETLILYNDAPAAWPAGVANYDYYTGAPDMRDTGGYGTGGVWNPQTGTYDNGTGSLPGYAPNTRTVMQIIVKGSGNSAGYVYNKANIEKEFTASAPATAINPLQAYPNRNTVPESTVTRTQTLFERSQEPIVVGQSAYKPVYPSSYFPKNFPWEGINQINDHFLQFVTLAGDPVKVPSEPKGLHDEMGASFDPVYGRMSGNLGMQLPNPTNLTALLILYGFSDIPTEFIQNSDSVNVQVLKGPQIPYTVSDGTQIWKISHNGVDTHPIHFHIFDVQVINRVGWDGQILMPEPNELGWKETVKISPLEDTIIAVRPRAPLLPFGIPTSIRPLNPAIPMDSVMGFTGTMPTLPIPLPPVVMPLGSDWPIPMETVPPTIKPGFVQIDPVTGGAYGVAPALPPYPGFRGVVTNVLYNFGWEYVWHCHILSHEEMDMMRPIVLNVGTVIPAAPQNLTVNTNAQVCWTDTTPPGTSLGNSANEIGFRIERADTTGNLTFNLVGKALANASCFTDPTAVAGASYFYRVIAYNASGDSVPSNVGQASVGGFTPPNVTITSPVNGTLIQLFSTITITADAVAFDGLTIANVEFYVDGTLICTDTAAPYSCDWIDTSVKDQHAISVKATDSRGISSLATITIYDRLLSIVTPSPLPNATVGVPYSKQLVAEGGIRPRYWAYVSGSLPAGLSFNTATATISGTPLNVGDLVSNNVFTYTVGVLDSMGTFVYRAYSITVVFPPTITTAATLPNAMSGVPYSQQLTASNGTTPYTWVYASGALPAGLTFNAATATISGTPDFPVGNTVFSYTAGVMDSTGVFGYKTFSLTVLAIQPLVISTATLPNGAVNAAYNQTVAATGGFGTRSWAATGLPSGYSINPATGVISGTTVFTAGTFATYTVNVSVTDSLNAVPVSKSLNLRINQTAPAAPSGLNAVATSGTQVVLSWVDNANNESGVQIQRATNNLFTAGVVTVYRYIPNLTTYTDTTVSAGTTYFYRVRSLNSLTFSASYSNTATVTPQIPPLAITTAALPNGSVNVAYSQAVVATGGTGAYTWSASGLPAGYSINTTTGTISGTTAFTSGTFITYNVSVIVTDGASTSSSATLSLRINQSAPASPSTLLASTNVSGQVILSWVDNANNEIGVQIQRATNNLFTTGLTTVYRYIPNLVTFTDTSVTPLTTYYYRVRALNSLTFSPAYTNSVNVTTP